MIWQKIMVVRELMYKKLLLSPTSTVEQLQRLSPDGPL